MGRAAHSWAVFHGWLTYCRNCRMCRLPKSPASMKRANKPCQSSWAS